MKFLVLVIVIGVVLWFALRRDGTGSRAARRRGPTAPQPMVRCAHCGVHLPQDEAVAGGDSLYCSEAHRALGRKTPLD
jgi:uncharacterized protein